MAVKYIPQRRNSMMKCPRCQRSIPFTRPGKKTRCRCGWTSGAFSKS